MTLRLKGELSIREWGEGGHDTLYCGETIVAEWAEDKLKGEQVRLRYWVSDKEERDDAIKQRALEQILGRADVDWGAAYSDVTGYLWTDEKFNVGGHDMIAEFSGSVGKYLLLEVDIGSPDQLSGGT